MKICASLSKKEDLLQTDVKLVEIRSDLFKEMPDVGDKDVIITLRDNNFKIPEDFKGILDIGAEKRPQLNNKIIASHHDFNKTPSKEIICNTLKQMDSDVCKGAYTINSFEDLNTIYEVSREINKPHILLGMGDLGKITRIRQELLGNEFTFGYVGEPTAPGQFSVKELEALEDDCMITGLVGNPISASMSPIMHNEAFKKLRISGIYLPFSAVDTVGLDSSIRNYKIRGVNVTVPYKTDAIKYCDELDFEAEKIGAINTIVNNDGALKGYNTDAVGIRTALNNSGFDIKGCRAVILGSGGAARACCHVLHESGCGITVVGRNAKTLSNLSEEFGCKIKDGNSISLGLQDLIVNCTPCGMYGDNAYPIPLKGINREHTIFDMVYGKQTPLIQVAKDVGANTISGADMLAAQGAESFRLWTGKSGMYDCMRGMLP